MYETGHSPSTAAIREALGRLEAAVAQQKGRLEEAIATAQPACEPVLTALRKSVWMMEQEAEHLRALLTER